MEVEGTKPRGLPWNRWRNGAKEDMIRFELSWEVAQSQGNGEGKLSRLTLRGLKAGTM